MANVLSEAQRLWRGSNTEIRTSDIAKLAKNRFEVERRRGYLNIVQQTNKFPPIAVKMFTKVTIDSIATVTPSLFASFSSKSFFCCNSIVQFRSRLWLGLQWKDDCASEICSCDAILTYDSLSYSKLGRSVKITSFPSFSSRFIYMAPYRFGIFPHDISEFYEKRLLH